MNQLVPFVHVTDVEHSIRFYKLLGFEVQDTYELRRRLDWAHPKSVTAHLMLAHADAPIDPRRQAVLFYLYADDLEALRRDLIAEGVAAGEIVDGSPGPAQEMALADPDGYCLMVAQTEPAGDGDQPA